jgi:Carbohydrate binding domain (family 11).
MVPAALARDGKTIQITGVEDSAVAITTFGDPGSKITATYDTTIAQEDKQPILIQAQTASWAGVVLVLEGEKADWTGMTTFKMWVYGSGSKKRFDVQFEDTNGELFLVNIKDDFTGWKQFSFKLSDIKPRKDYQDPKAKLNKIIDYPLKTLQFCTTNAGSGGSGKLSLYFDNFEVANE